MGRSDFDHYQQVTRNTALYPAALSGLDSDGAPSKAAMSYCAMGLMGEAGEVCNKVKKIMRGDYDADREGVDEHAMEDALVAIQDEIGDTLWYLARLADEMDVELSVISSDNVVKLQDRWSRGVIQGDGDQR